MRISVRTVAATGLVMCAAAVVLLLWPLSANGVEGNAVRPHYVPFGWTSYEPLPVHPRTADLRRAGISVPQDAVHHRRRVAEVIGGIGLVLLSAGAAGRLAENRNRVGV